jgi:hypothetical protein
VTEGPVLEKPGAAVNPHEREKVLFEDSDVAAAIHHFILWEKVEATSTFESTEQPQTITKGECLTVTTVYFCLYLSMVDGRLTVAPWSSGS